MNVFIRTITTKLKHHEVKKNKSLYAYANDVTKRCKVVFFPSFDNCVLSLEKFC